MYLIGKIATTHGIRGGIKVNVHTDFDRFKVNSSFYLLDNDNKIYFNVESVTPQNNRLILKLKGYNTIESITPFIGKELYVDSIDNLNLKEDEFHYSYLINKKVIDDSNGELIGTVISILDYPLNKILEIETTKGIVMIPFIKEFIVEVNDSNIKVKIIEGLI
ncbi:MAG: ribosome maturation factor RimM [Acholeplasmatales bacterium]|jgi:16S rRNA processing protein RimM|nr:ribosome maturation factor RimM [Acholeplasmatales bacterium]